MRNANNFDFLRTHCETVNEDQVILEEIEKVFPTNVQNDFGEFIEEKSSDEIIKKATPKKSDKTLDVLSMEDMKFLCKSFIDIMNKFSRFVPIIWILFQRYFTIRFQVLLSQSPVAWWQRQSKFGLHYSLQNEFLRVQPVDKEIQIVPRYRNG